jgi:hemin uptake protein HemP
MPTPPQISPPIQAPHGAHVPPTRPPTGDTSLPDGLIDSRALFQGQRTIAIQHNGTVYRLQATRLGKLILTK